MSGYVGRLYQWKDGEKAGQYEVVEAEEAHDIKFESGARIGKDELNALMVEQAIPGMDMRREVPQSYIDMVSAVEPVPSSPPLPAPLTEDAIIEGIFAKQQSYDVVSVSFPIKLPNKKVVDLLCSMYDKEQVGRIIGKRSLASLKEGLDSDEFRTVMADFAKEYYTNA